MKINLRTHIFYRIVALVFLLAGGFSVQAQTPIFTRQDTLRGSITPERAWWDLTYYHLDIKVNPADSTIRGKNTVQYKVLQPNQTLQLDLQAPMQIEKVTQNGKPVTFTREGNAYFLKLT